MKNVQIPERLLLELYSYHVLNRRSPMVDEQYMRDELTKKFTAWNRRVEYSADLERQRSEHIVLDGDV